MGDLQLYNTLVKLCDNDALVPAEVALQQTSLMKLVNLKDLMDMREPLCCACDRCASPS